MVEIWECLNLDHSRCEWLSDNSTLVISPDEVVSKLGIPLMPVCCAGICCGYILCCRRIWLYHPKYICKPLLKQAGDKLQVTHVFVSWVVTSGVCQQDLVLTKSRTVFVVLYSRVFIFRRRWLWDDHPACKPQRIVLYFRGYLQII